MRPGFIFLPYNRTLCKSFPKAARQLLSIFFLLIMTARQQRGENEAKGKITTPVSRR
jgi:hypothetical protein